MNTRKIISKCLGKNAVSETTIRLTKEFNNAKNVAEAIKLKNKLYESKIKDMEEEFKRHPPKQPSSYGIIKDEDY